MKSPFIPVAALAGAVLGGEPEPRLEITMEKPAGPVARWDAKVPPIVGAQAEYRLLTSPNLSVWTPASGSINATQTGPVESPLNADDGSTHRFFRLRRNISFAEAADPGAERNGFSSLYAAELKELG